MKANTTLLLLFFTITALLTNAQTGTEKKQEKPKRSFAEHSFEFQVTPSADYHIWHEGSAFVDKPYEYSYPFVGFGFGAQYLYRPVEVFGISTGLAVKMQGGFTRVRTYPLLGESYISSRSNHHLGYITVPIYFHLYKAMKDCTFEFAIGPDFNFPTFSRGSTTIYNSAGDKVSTSSSSDKWTASEMREGASFGLSLFLGGQLYLCEHANLFVGPQIQFLNLVYFDKDLNESVRKDGDFINSSLGLKLGFRFH